MTPGKARRARALAMHRAGQTYRTIGVAMGVSASRVGQLVRLALRDEAYVPPPPPPPRRKIAATTKLDDLPWTVRTYNVLRNCCFETVGDLLRADRAAFRSEMLRVPNCNRKSWDEIERVLDMIETDERLAAEPEFDDAETGGTG